MKIYFVHTLIFLFLQNMIILVKRIGCAAFIINQYMLVLSDVAESKLFYTNYSYYDHINLTF